VHRTWRNGLSGLAVTLLLAAGGLVGTTTSAAAAAAQSATIADTGYYKIVHKRTGKCVDVPDSSHATGARIQEWDCHGGANQRWTGIYQVDGSFLLQSKNTPSMCITVGIIDGPHIYQTTCFPYDGEKWRWRVANSNGDLQLVSAFPGNLCLALSPDTDRNGTKLDALPCSETDNVNFWHPVY
jgi:hypothetical protein